MANRKYRDGGVWAKAKVFINGDFMSTIKLILGLVFLWALLFGVQVDGKYYGFVCSCDSGVILHNGTEEIPENEPAFKSKSEPDTDDE